MFARGATLIVLVLTQALWGTAKPDPAAAMPAFVQALRASRSGIRSVALRFTQAKDLALLDVRLESEGRLFFQRPSSLRYEILSPARSVLLYDGRRVRNHAFSEGRWRALRSPGAEAIGQVMRQIGAWLQGDFAPSEDLFRLEATPDPNGGGVIRLRPAAAAMERFIQAIDLQVAVRPQPRVTRVTIRETAHDVTILRFQEERLNRTLPAAAFTAPEAGPACEAVFESPQPCDPNAPPSHSS